MLVSYYARACRAALWRFDALRLPQAAPDVPTPARIRFLTRRSGVRLPAGRGLPLEARSHGQRRPVDAEGRGP